MIVFNDILKENNKFSQGRVYLFISIIVYYLTHGIIMCAGLWDWNVDVMLLEDVAKAVEYPMTTFATYTLGGKVVDVFNKNKK